MFRDDGFDRIECCGNSYERPATEFIANLIKCYAAEEFHYADFSDMFKNLPNESIPEALSPLIDVLINTRNIQTLNLNDNDLGLAGV